ncbi:acyltransferase [Tessaracoccus rhinocerotis]|uniref:Acyltransferase n=1 Tax=Tessaracoccus rhinocerotis TaxID=1689449 RepID=A0A553JZC8_9ACTN|nr:acyltransferase [Tessaracoccus rhinocerotis]TRY17794.1 acyltransferase [Tessaracoccus rhinocerotis]
MSNGERLHWADTAKAVAVVLVVVYHVALTALKNFAPGAPYSEQFWGVLSTWLLPVRMPLFFLVSGVLAVRALRRPWPRVLRPRLLDNLWTFGLWTTAIAVFYALAYAPQVFGEFMMRALSWTLTFGGFYWYLPLLMAFFVTAKLLRRAPWLVVGIGVVLYVIASDLPRSLDAGALSDDALLTLIRYCQFLVFFALGAFVRPLVVLAARTHLAVVAVLVVAYVPIARFTYSPDGVDLTPLLTVMGCTAVLGLSQFVSRWDRVRRLGRHLAERTLPIYLVHPFALTLVTLALPALPALRTRHTLFLVPLLVIALVALSIWLYDRTRHRLPWLYRTPGAPRESTAAEVEDLIREDWRTTSTGSSRPPGPPVR